MQDLLAAALEAKSRAYAPYSRFPVGAAIRGADGGIYTGCNVENASYPLGLCAETSAVAAMVTDGERRIREILVVADGSELCSPCGGCRQLLNEFADGDVAVHICGPEGLRRTFSMSELLPLAFGPEHLK